MKTIWALEDGCYSDYHVIGIFTSKENAEVVQRHVGGTIAEWPLDPMVHELNKGYRCWLGEMLHDGTVERMVEWEISGYSMNNSIYVWPRSTAPAYQGKHVQDCLHGTVLAKTRTHAIKIFNEKRAELIAANKFLPLNSPQPTW